jgi:chemotaxis protein MotB
MKTKRKQAERHPVDHHRWIISYADFITLLFAFFVVMYAVSSVNGTKYKSLAEGMNSAFNKKKQNKTTDTTIPLKNAPQASNTQAQFDGRGMADLKNSLSQITDGTYQLNSQEGWIELDIKAGALFEQGTASLKPQAILKLMQLAGKIKDLSYGVVIEGYTDNIPINTPAFPSNWELSATRAAAVGRALNGFGIETGRILVTGYGDQYPLADNATEEGRFKNRRVNIIIVRDRSVSRLFNPLLDQIHNTLIQRDEKVESTLKPQENNNDAFNKD